MSVCALVTITRGFSVKLIIERSVVPVGPSYDVGEFPCSGSCSVSVSAVRGQYSLSERDGRRYDCSNEAFRLQRKEAAAQCSERPPDCQNSSALLNCLIRFTPSD
jgi:hypothetical protein